MPQWRIRAVVPDGHGGYRALKDALAAVPATAMEFVPHAADRAETTGDMVVELDEDSSLPDLLRALHEISPQVFISRVSPDESAVPSGSGIRTRRLRGAQHSQGLITRMDSAQ
jgi:hypothetical protein